MIIDHRRGDDEGRTKVKIGGVSGSNRPGNGYWAGGVDLGRRLIELQGGYEGEGEEECAARARSISLMVSWTFVDSPEIFEHDER